MELTDEELRRRRPVWLALSELFLDTELDDDDRHRIALVLHASGYDGVQLDAIYAHEVAPVCGANLMTVAGEWAGFDPEWLEGRILARRRSALTRAAGWLTSLLSAPAVVSVLRSDYTKVKELLARLRTDRGALLRSLEGAEPEALESVKTLALQGELARSPETFAALERALGRREPPVRSAALLALALVDPQRSIPVLSVGLRADRPEERRAALEALFEASRRLGDAAARQESLVAALEPWLRAPDPRDRKRALMVVEQLARSPGTVALLLRSLDQPVEDHQLALASAMRAAQPPIADVEQPLIEALRASSPSAVRHTAAQVLVFLTADGRETWSGVAARLLPFTSDRDPRVQARIATALGWIGEPAALEPLCVLAGSSEVEVRASALYALGRVGRSAPERVLPALRDALAGEESATRSAALRAAAELGPAAAPLEPELRRALKHDNFFVRYEAKLALEAIAKRAG